MTSRADRDRLDVNYPRAAAAGLLSAMAVAIVATALRRRGIPLHVERAIGTFLAPDMGATFAAGLVVFLALGTAAGLVYASIMGSRHRYDWWAALPIAAAHVLVSGAITALAPAVHPRIPTQIRSPGPFLASGGARSVVAFVLLHAFFAAMFGILYTWSSKREEHAWT